MQWDSVNELVNLHLNILTLETTEVYLRAINNSKNKTAFFNANQIRHNIDTKFISLVYKDKIKIITDMIFEKDCFIIVTDIKTKVLLSKKI